MPKSTPLFDLRQHPERRFKLIGFSLFLLFTVICYWSMPSLIYQEWDSIANAGAVENYPLPLEWGNHPLVHLIQSIVYRVAINVGYDGRALTLLQIINTLATGASIAVFFVILVRRMGLDIKQAAGWAAFLGSGYSILSFAGTAEIYSVSLLLMLLAWSSMLFAFTRPEPSHLIIAGVLIGLAGLAHQFGAILLGAGVVAGFFYQLRKAMIIGGVMVATLVLGYGLLGYLATSSLDPHELLSWIRGYVGESIYGRSFSLEGLHLAKYSGTRSLIRGAETDLYLLRMLLLGIIVLIFLSLPFQRRLWASDYIRTGIYCMLPILIGLPLIIWWEPGLEGKFWLLLAPFFTTLLALGVPDIKRWAWFVPASLAVSVLFINQLSGLQDEHKPDQVFEASLQTWIDHSSRSDVLYESKMFTEYLMFLGDRPRTISAGSLFDGYNDINNPYRPLQQAIEDAWARGASVLYTEGINDYYDDHLLAKVGASRDGLDAFFRSYRREGPVFEYRETVNGPVKRVFRLLPPINRKPES